MSELDNPLLDLEDDAPDTATIEEEETESEETDQIEEDMDTEMTDHEKLKKEFRLFVELYTAEKNEITLGVIKASNWNQYFDKHRSWTMYQKVKPLRNHDTILKQIKFIKARINTIVWDENYMHALQQAFLQSQNSKTYYQRYV